MSSSEIVPFGKYKGQPVEILSQDKRYCDWLMAQDFFKQQFPELRTIIINNFQEPSETPEHNALQVKFLSEEYRLKFAVAAVGGLNQFLKRIEESLEIGHEKRICFNIDEIAEISVDCLFKAFDLPSYSILREHKSIERRVKWCSFPDMDKHSAHVKKILKEALLSFKFTLNPFGNNLTMEDTTGTDVVFNTEFEFSDTIALPRDTRLYMNYEPFTQHSSRLRNTFNINANLRFYETFRIEVKPVVSDDFPSVLRQMSRQHSAYLFLEKYTGQGASEQEFVEFFRTKDITVVFRRDVENINIGEVKERLSNFSLSNIK